jgi:hypothetical protein
VKKSFLCSPLKCRSIQTEPICRWCFKFCPPFLLDTSLSFLCFQAPSIKECFLLWAFYYGLLSEKQRVGLMLYDTVHIFHLNL